MVELEIADYKTLIKWFELAFAKNMAKRMTIDDKRTFWKLSFLAEDKIQEMKDGVPDDD